MATISDTAGHATEQVREAASHARSAFFDFSTQVLKLINGAREAEGRGVDALLDRMGLQRRQSALGPVLWFAAGAAIAGTAVLLMSPTSGKALRRRIASFLGSETPTPVVQKPEAEPPRTPEEASRVAPTGGNGVQHGTR